MPIGRPYLQKFWAAMQEEKAVKGLFINTGTFASTAYEYAKKSRIELIDMEGLLKLTKKAYGKLEMQPKTQAIEVIPEVKQEIKHKELAIGTRTYSSQHKQCVTRPITPDIDVKESERSSFLRCPRCGEELIVKRDNNTSYLVCHDYPSCSYNSL